MRIRQLYFTIAIVCLGFGTNYAQIDLKKIAKETERSINKRVNRGVERGVDNALDNAEDQVRGKNKKKKNKNKGEEYDEGGTTTIIKEVEPFNFSGNLTILIDGSGEIDDNLIKVVSDKFDFAVRPMLVKKPNNLMIYDKQSGSVTKVNTELYTDKALREFVEYEAHNAKKTKTELERTSDIKEIQTYIARKYYVEGDDYEGEIWLSAEVDLDYDLFATLMEFQRLDLGTNYGFPLEMHISFKNGDKMDWTTKEIEGGDPDQTLLDISEYELIDMTDLKSGN